MVGAGPAGLRALRRLRERAGAAVEVVLIAPGRRVSFLAGALDVALGLSNPEEVSAPLALEGVDVRDASAVRVSASGVHVASAASAPPADRAAPPADRAAPPADRAAPPADGAELIAAEAVIAAPGLALRDPGRLPDWSRAVWAWDPRGAEAFAHLLAGAGPEEPGELLIAAAGLPYRCPPAPFALAIRLAERRRSRGLPAQVTVAVPEPVPLAGVGATATQLVLDACAHAGVSVQAGFLPDLEASADGVLLAADGRSIQYAAALMIPPHERPACLQGLPGEGPMVAVGEDGSVEGSSLFVVGDAAATGMPRAAGIGEGNAVIAADSVLARLGVAPVPAREPVSASCFMFHTGGLASRIRVSYPPGSRSQPEVAIDGPSAELVAEREGERERFLASAAAP